jgi:protein-tyrosine kinase
VSKIFQALERAERERALERTPQERRQRDSRADNKELSPSSFSQREHTQRRCQRYDENHPLGDLHPSVDGHLVGLLDPMSFEAEQYRTVCYSLEQLHKGKGLTTIAISSPTVSDGKTTTAINIAATLSQDPATKILLIDLDLRRPSVSRLLGLSHSQGPGVTDFVLRSGFSLRDVILECPSFHLDLLLSGSSTQAPHETLKEPKFEQLLQEARYCYDYVIVDTPPIVPFPDCRFLEPWIDGILLIVTAHKTPRELVSKAIDSINPTKMIGILFNNDDQSESQYYSSYYYSKETKKTEGFRWLQVFKELLH